MSTVLVVCTGNICRSPILEGLLRHLLAEHGIEGVDVESAGVSGWDELEPSPDAVEALRELGVDISGHRARRLGAAHIESADLVLALAAEHRDAISRLAPGAASRTFTLKEMIHLLRRLPRRPMDGEDPAARLQGAATAAAALRAAGAEAAVDEDVADPIGQGLESYRATVWELETLSRQFVDLVFGGTRGMRGGGEVRRPREEEHA
jgi:protein-tyrosine phosphatase